MRNSANGTTRPSRRQTWLTVSRITNLILAFTTLAAVVILLCRPTSQPIKVTVAQADKVAAAASYLQDVGFNNPVYLGITPGTEGKYPTFRATAIGGKSVDLWIRTTSNGGWEIQPNMMFETVSSAEDFARKAVDAVSNWEHMPPNIKPRTDGTYGEYESRKYDYEQLKAYNPDKSYWPQTDPNETAGWPAK